MASVGRDTAGDLGLFSHAHGTVDGAALEHDDALGMDVSLDRGSSLDLHAVAGDNGPDDGSAEDGIDGVDIAVDFPRLAKEELAGTANRAFDSALDLDDAGAFDIADDTHPAPDDRHGGFGVGGVEASDWAVGGGLVEDGHGKGAGTGVRRRRGDVRGSSP